jgi:hypothetical protein
VGHQRSSRRVFYFRYWPLSQAEKETMQWKNLVSLALALMLGACGGGGGSPTDPGDVGGGAPPPPVFVSTVQIFGPQSRPKQPWYMPDGSFIQLPVAGKLEARLDWTPPGANVELYITKSPRSSSDFLTCVSYEESCTGALAADVDPLKRPKKATTEVLQPHEYAVLIRPTGPDSVQLSGEAGYYAAAVSASSTSGAASARVVGRFWFGADGNIIYEMYR